MSTTQETSNTQAPSLSRREELSLRRQELDATEVYWRDHYVWLKQMGYLLRPRYNPEWIPSWKGTNKSWISCEDAQIGDWPDRLMEATRVSDELQVQLKKLPISHASESEIDIAQFFSKDPHKNHPSNHCVPFYEVIKIPNEDTYLAVMPFLTHWEEPAFETIGEVLEFFRQIFEGVQFMHSLNVAHNDIKFDNVMMNAMPLYDEPPHPVDPTMNKAYTHPLEPRSRSLRPVKYYLIDFGEALPYNLAHGEPRIPVGQTGYGGDKNVPEFSTNAEYCDPFPVDVCRLGNIIRFNFTDKNEEESIYGPKRGLSFMEPLVRDMCHKDPAKRPKMHEVVKRFEVLTASLPWWKLRSRVIPREEHIFLRMFRFPGHWGRQAIAILKRRPAIPNFTKT
ncbi:kinase-like domain-containing protein [Collybia nuda]|uniref:Kinase-like domain-containing protein n=1 Tax=Collybia nuda TaxID=64659 RepID=A0A9P6CJ08_9AGAR|nr:kinase-like domain-containing protein [Collybia nuda]